MLERNVYGRAVAVDQLSHVPVWVGALIQDLAIIVVQRLDDTVKSPAVEVENHQLIVESVVGEACPLRGQVSLCRLPERLKGERPGELRVEPSRCLDTQLLNHVFVLV